MALHRRIIDELRVVPGDAADLAHRSTTWDGPPSGKGRAESVLEDEVEQLRDLQELLWASDDHAVLVVFQALDAAGKDGTIKHVMSGVNPQGCDVHGFRQPSQEELHHTFLWRCMTRLPERGHIGIFNRSYYEDVLVVRVHPELLPPGKHGDGLWRARFDDINAFEHHLDRNRTTVVKFFLHVSKEEQRQRFLARLEDPHKHWKWSDGDLAERARWDDYQHAYEEAITATSTKWAPWYVVPADSKPTLRALVAGVLVHELSSLPLAWPTVSEDQKARIEDAKRLLARED